MSAHRGDFGFWHQMVLGTQWTPRGRRHVGRHRPRLTQDQVLDRADIRQAVRTVCRGQSPAAQVDSYIRRRHAQRSAIHTHRAGWAA